MIFNGIDIEIERKPIKNLHLAVYPPDGRVHISVPIDYDDERIRMYILQKWIWIEEKREMLLSYNRLPERQSISGETHYFKGTKYRLKVNRHTSGAYSVHIDGDYIVVDVHQDTSSDNIRQTLYSWYKTQTLPIFGRLVLKWQEILGVVPARWEVRQMTSRWGSCSQSKGVLLFNIELAKKSIECIEYVVAHEMTHLIERNHTDRFRRLMDIHLSSWQKIRTKLNEYPI